MDDKERNFEKFETGDDVIATDDEFDTVDEGSDEVASDPRDSINLLEKVAAPA